MLLNALTSSKSFWSLGKPRSTNITTPSLRALTMEDMSGEKECLQNVFVNNATMDTIGKTGSGNHDPRYNFQR